MYIHILIYKEKIKIQYIFFYKMFTFLENTSITLH